MGARGVRLLATVAACAAHLGLATAASSFEIVLHDVAADRVERQRAFARGGVPLPGTPDLLRLSERLSERGLAKGRAVYLRVFKEESELELWMQNGGGTFTLLAAYPICHWTGTIGPKLKEGDKQSPEGFYSVGKRQTRLVGRWRRAFNLGFPNLHDQLLNRTGSYILIHGGCSSVGCFAMTDQVQEEIFGLVNAALSSGQERFQVHVFPFRMTDANMAAHADHEWAHTWADLQPAYESFERTRIPPRVVLCGVRYKIADGLPGETGGSEGRLQVLKPASQGPQSDDRAAVVDSSGGWGPPACMLDDEDRRKAAYTLAGATGGELPTTEPNDRLIGPPVVNERAPTASEINQRKSVAKSAKSVQRAVPTNEAKAPIEGRPDGFGTALPSTKERITATGG